MLESIVRLGFIGLIVTLLLAACAQIPGASLLALRRFDPMTADPDRLRAAVVLPAAIGAKPMDMRMTVVSERKTGGDREQLALKLIEVDAASDPLPEGAVGPGTVAHIYRVNPADIARLVAFRQAITARAAAEPGAFGGSVNIGAQNCGKDAHDWPPGPLLISTYLKTDQTDGFVPLLVNYDLAEAIRALPKPAAGAAEACLG